MRIADQSVGFGQAAAISCQNPLSKRKAASGRTDGLGKHKEVWTVVKVALRNAKRCASAHR